jgi:hypothetical protein
MNQREGEFALIKVFTKALLDHILVVCSVFVFYLAWAKNKPRPTADLCSHRVSGNIVPAGAEGVLNPVT